MAPRKDGATMTRRKKLDLAKVIENLASQVAGFLDKLDLNKEVADHHKAKLQKIVDAGDELAGLISPKNQVKT
jgi:hypothetical protein